MGDWVPWEFQHEDHEAPSNSENCNEVVSSPPTVKRNAEKTKYSEEENNEHLGAELTKDETVRDTCMADNVQVQSISNSHVRLVHPSSHC